MPAPTLATNLPARPLAEEAREYFEQARSPNTLRAYRADWRHFENWCAVGGREALPAAASTLVLYLTELARSARVSTLARRLTAVGQAHEAAGVASSTAAAPVRTLMAGIRRAKGIAPRPKKALAPEDLRRMVHVLPADSLLGARDRALLLAGFVGAFRRSELVALDWADLEFVREGVVVILRRSKTDQEGEGRKVALPYARSAELCPVRALECWRDLAGDAGPVFRAVDRHGNVSGDRLSDRTVARCVKKALKALGVAGEEYAGHSLRSGFATAAAAAGASERAIMNQTGHRSLAVLRRYIRDGALFEENAAARLVL